MRLSSPLSRDEDVMVISTYRGLPFSAVILSSFVVRLRLLRRRRRLLAAAAVSDAPPPPPNTPTTATTTTKTTTTLCREMRAAACDQDLKILLSLQS